MAVNKLSPYKSLFVAITILLFSISPVFASSGQTIAFQTDHQMGGKGDYDGYGAVVISGNVLPPPQNGSVIIKTTSPQGAVMASDVEPLQPGTGMFQDTVITGCTAAWVAGTYTITASLSGSPSVVATTTFGYIVDSPALDTVSVNAVLGSGTVTISGAVQACGGSAAQSSVILTIKNPDGATVLAQVAQPISYAQPEDGDYSVTVPVNGALWISGTYTVSAFYTSTQSLGTPASATTTFTYTTTPAPEFSAQTTEMVLALSMMAVAAFMGRKSGKV